MFDFIVRLFGFRPYTNDYRVSDDYLYKMEEKELSQDIKQNKNNDELYLKTWIQKVSATVSWFSDSTSYLH